MSVPDPAVTVSVAVPFAVHPSAVVVVVCQSPSRPRVASGTVPRVAVTSAPEVAHARLIAAWLAAAVTFRAADPSTATAQSSAWSTPSGRSPGAGVHAPPPVIVTEATSVTASAVNSAFSTPSVLAGSLQVTVTVDDVPARRLTVRVRSARWVPVPSVTVPTGAAVHRAVSGSTVNVSATATVPVPGSVVSSRPSMAHRGPARHRELGEVGCRCRCLTRR